MSLRRVAYFDDMPMRALVGYVMRGPWQAVLVASAMALLSLFPLLGFMSVFSGAVVALVGLCRGFKPALTVMLGTAVVMAAVSQMMVSSVGLGLVYVVVVWAPLLALALVLRNTVSWPITLDVAALFGIVAVIIIYLVFGNPPQVWEHLLTQLVTAMERQNVDQDFSAFRAQIPVAAQWVTGVLAAALVIGLIASMMLARWWQSLLQNQGGFAQEFHALRQSRSTSLLALLILVLASVDFGMISAVSADIVFILLVVYSVFGLGLVHALVATSGLGSKWLIIVYVLAIVALPYVVKALAALGFADSWPNFRSWLKRRGPGSGKPHDDS